MADNWELTWFGNLLRDGAGDFDGDGQRDADEFDRDTCPVDNLDPFRIEARFTTPDRLEISWITQAGLLYQLRARADLADAWANIGEPFPGDGRVARVNPSLAGTGRQFFQVAVLP